MQAGFELLTLLLSIARVGIKHSSHLNAIINLQISLYMTDIEARTHKSLITSLLRGTMKRQTHRHRTNQTPLLIQLPLHPAILPRGEEHQQQAQTFSPPPAPLQPRKRLPE